MTDSGLARLARALLGCAWILAASGAGADGAAAEVSFAGRPVVDVLDEYRRSGFRLVYSNRVVPASLHFTREPSDTGAQARLAEALEDVGLELRRESNGDRLLVVSAGRSAAASRTVSGTVKDAFTGRPIANAHVEIPGQTAITGADGRFTLVLSDAATSLLVQRDGYEDGSFEPSEHGPMAGLDIELAPTQHVEEILVVSPRYVLKKSDRTSRFYLDADELMGLPEVGDDALRAAIHLPGVASIGLSARPHIRGGYPDETLILFDQVELIEPFHLKDFQSVFSSFSPSLVESIDVYTGGFPARYGDRMSGVMDVDVADEHDAFGAQVSLSLLTAEALVRGAAGTTGNWALSGRRGNLDLVTQAVNPGLGDPTYSDWYAQLGWDVGERRIDFGALVYDGDIVFDTFDEGAGERAQSDYRNVYVWGQLHDYRSDTSESTTTISIGSLRHDRNGLVVDEDIADASGFMDSRLEVDVVSLAHLLAVGDASGMFDAELGGRISYQKARYALESFVGTSKLGELIGNTEEVSHSIRLAPEGGSGYVFASVRLRPLTRLAVESGVRWDFQDYGGSGLREQWSPRFSARYDLDERTVLRAAAGRFHQAEGVHELQVADGVTAFQVAQHADHYVVGLERRWANGLGLRIETYQKRFSNPRARYENLFDPLVLIPEIAPDRVLVAPRRGRAEGIETTILFEPAPDLNAWVSYTRQAVDDLIDGQWRPRSWSQEHTFGAGVTWNWRNWSFSGLASWHSGWRTTPLPDQIDPDAGVVAIARNSAELRNYFSLDARVARTWEWSDATLTLFAEATNLTDRVNVGALEYDLSDEDGLLEVEAENESLLPRIPSIGVVVRFR